MRGLSKEPQTKENVPITSVVKKMLEKKKKNWVSREKVVQVEQSHRGGGEVVIVPQISVVLHHASHEVQERLPFHLAGYTLNPRPVSLSVFWSIFQGVNHSVLGDVLIERASHHPPAHGPSTLFELLSL